VADDDGEAGFLVTADALQSRLNSNYVDGTVGDYLGEGDDAAEAPVLIDVLGTQTTLIPATSLRVIVSSAADPTYGPLVQDKVQDHRDAGFSTEIVDYCLTGHSQDRVTMAYGVMSAAGYFGAGDDLAAFPKVTGLKWGRQGWNYSVTSEPGYAGVKTLGAAGTAGTGGTPSNSACTGSTPDSELVRCTAQAAIGPTGGGATPTDPPSSATGLGIDMRTSTPALGYMGSGFSISLPGGTETLFSTGLGSLTTGKTLWFYNRTQHTAGMAAEGANMLGYTAQFQRWGLPDWNNTVPAEKLGDGAPWPSQDATAPDYYAIMTVANNVNSGPNTTVPVVTGGAASVSNITTTSADITRVTTDGLGNPMPATSKIALHDDTADVDLPVTNNTILNSTKTVAVNGLTAGHSYSGTLIAYSGNANASAPATVSFTAACNAGKPALSLGNPVPYWGSYADYTDDILSIDWTVSNTGTNDAIGVSLTNDSNSPGVTSYGSPTISLGDIAAGSSAGGTLQYNGAKVLPGFHTTNSGAASDDCGTVYTYP